MYIFGEVFLTNLCSPTKYGKQVLENEFPGNWILHFVFD